MRLCRYDLNRECKEHCKYVEECVACIIKEAKPHGNSQYKEGWTDALNYIASRLHINSIKSHKT